MKADANAALGFAPASNNANTRSAVGESRGDDRFARLMSGARESNPRAAKNDESRTDRPARTEDAPEARDAGSADRPSAQSTRRSSEARDGRTPREPRDDRNARDADAPDTAAAQSASATAQTVTNETATPQDEDDVSPIDWPPAGLILPALIADTAPLANPATGAFAAGDTLSGGAASALPTGLRMAFAQLATATGDGAAVPNLADAATDTPAGNAAASNTVADTAREQPGAMSLPAFTAVTRQPAGATANPSAQMALPAGMVLFKDTLEALSTGKREDSHALNAAFALAAPSTPSDNGLARTATVNPLTALTPDLNTDQFGETLGTQLSFMADQKISHARIRVSPHDMGTIEINLQLDGDRVHADFSSPQPEVRQALESSLPKLREMLGQQGFQLAQADVGHRQNPQSSPQEGNARGQGSDPRPMGTASEPAPMVRVVRGLLDAYA